MEPEGSLQRLEDPATDPCPEPARSSLCLLIQLPEDESSFHLRVGQNIYILNTKSMLYLDNK
jgi:hypothetical protein